MDGSQIEHSIAKQPISPHCYQLELNFHFHPSGCSTSTSGNHELSVAFGGFKKPNISFIMAGDPPLKGLHVVELAGIAPGQICSIDTFNRLRVSDSLSAAPFCGLLLASYGASVVRIDRPRPSSAALPPPTPDLLATGKASICLDLKDPRSRALLLSLLPHTDILVDPYRPGVLENINLDPETVLRKHNPRLIVSRLTGFRRDDQYCDIAGHDINYLAVSGILSLLGPSGQPPQPPANILADFAGGGLVAFTGILLALLRRNLTGIGQVVEANMVDGVSFLGSFPRLLMKTPLWDGGRGSNVLDGGAPFYRCYETKDSGKYVSVGALEPQFFVELLKGLGLTEKEIFPPQSDGDRNNKENWMYMKKVFEKRFREKTRSEWEHIFHAKDACVTPVLEMAELEQSGYEQRPMVHLTESPGIPVKDQWTGRPLKPGEGGEELLKEWLGWKRGRDYRVENGALVTMERSKL